MQRCYLASFARVYIRGYRRLDMERLWKKTQLRGQTGKGRGGSGKKNASSGVFFSFFFLPRVLSRAAPPNVGNWMAYGVAAYRRKKSSELINETLELWHLLIQ